MPKGSSKEQLTKNKKPKAIKGFGITVKLPATGQSKKKKQDQQVDQNLRKRKKA